MLGVRRQYMKPWVRRLGLVVFAIAVAAGHSSSGDDAGSNTVRLSAVAIPARAVPGDAVTLQCSLTNSGQTAISYYSVYGKIWYGVQEKAGPEKNWPAASKEPVLPRFRDGRHCGASCDNSAPSADRDQHALRKGRYAGGRAVLDPQR